MELFLLTGIGLCGAYLLYKYITRPAPVSTERFVGSGQRYVTKQPGVRLGSQSVVNQRGATAKRDIVGGNSRRSSSYDDGGIANPLHPANPLNPVYQAAPAPHIHHDSGCSHGHSSSWDSGSSSSSSGGGDSGGSCGGGD